uniref:Putative tick transposon n=1 Tax=Rhipicephalus pulchellus TaxID=72859 RepID=L7LXV3_RHIPC
MLQLYNALFLGFVRYSLPVMGNTCKTNLRVLQGLQAQALRTCLGLPKCASTAATIVIAGEHPMTTYITTDSLRAHIRHLARVPSHHLAYLPAERPRTTFSNIIAAHTTSLPSNYTPAARPSSPLWCLHRPEVRLNIPGVTKKKRMSSVALKQAALLHLHEVYSAHTHIYTDGSVTATSSTAAVIIPASSVTIQLKMFYSTSTTAAELVALRAALQFVIEQTPNSWAIFCDSKAALQSLPSALRHGSHEQLVAEIRQVHHDIIEKGHTVIFQWMPSHCGIQGNDQADAAARSAHNGVSSVAIPLSRSDAAKELRVLARRLTLDLWHSPTYTSARLHTLDPDLKLRIPSGLSRRHSTLLARLWLGVAFSNAYSFLIGMSDSPLCEVCGCSETVAHLLCDCTRFNSERDTLSAALRQLDNRPLTEFKILGPWPTRSATRAALRALLRFLEATGLSEKL